MQLLQYFKELSLYPKNAKELKGLILQLAVQGKLTANWRLENPDVEPASVLLERIQEEKARLIKKGKIKKEKPLTEIKKDDFPYELPRGWIWCRVGNISTIKGGKRIPKGFNLLDQKTPHIYIRVTDMKNGTVSFSKLKYISEEVYEKIKSYTISKDDLYITIAGTIGDIGEIPAELDNMNLTENAAKITLYNLHKDYLKLMLQSPFCRSQFLDKVNQMAQPKLALHRISSTLIPLPPLKEQKAIVETVNQLFAEVEQLEALTQERILQKENFVSSALLQLQTGNTEKEWAFLREHFSGMFTEKTNIKKLRETVLQQAVQGKLTAHWRKENPEVEPASVLLERIQEEKARLIKEGKIKKEKPLPKIKEEEIPYDLPEGWVWCKMQDIMKSLRYGTSKKCEYGFGKNPVLRIPNLLNGKIDIENLKSTHLNEKELKDLSLSKGDILLIRSNGSVNLVGRSAVVKNTGIGFSFAGYLVRMQIFIKEIEADFLQLMLASPFIRQSIEGPIRSTSGVKNLNSTEIAQLLFSLPPLEEQKAIVKKTNVLMALFDHLDQEIDQSQTQVEQLMQSCLREVFEGKEAGDFQRV